MIFGPECKEFVDFEQRMQPKLDVIYASKGWVVVDRQGTREYDLKLQVDGKTYTIEEKILSKDYGNLLVEVLQDVTAPKERPKWGWVYTCKADFLFWIVCEDEEVRTIYTINMKGLLEFYHRDLSSSWRLLVSRKGYGVTLNVGVKWYQVPSDIFRRHVIQATSPHTPTSSPTCGTLR